MPMQTSNMCQTIVWIFTNRRSVNTVEGSSITVIPPTMPKVPRYVHSARCILPARKKSRARQAYIGVEHICRGNTHHG